MVCYTLCWCCQKSDVVLTQISLQDPPPDANGIVLKVTVTLSTISDRTMIDVLQLLVETFRALLLEDNL